MRLLSMNQGVYRRKEAHMKGTLIIAMLIAMLVTGWLVIKNMTTENVDGLDRMETVQKAKDTAGVVDDALKKMKKAME